MKRTDLRKAYLAKCRREGRKPYIIPPRGKRGRRLAKGDARLRKVTKADGECLFQGYRFQCSGPLEDMHILGRDDESIRHEPLNHVCGCHEHHDYFTNHNKEFQEVIEQMYPGRIEALYRLRRGEAA